MNSHLPGVRSQREGLWSWNPVSNRVHFSSEWLRLVGCTEHEAGNTHAVWLQRVHPEDVDQVSRAIDASLTDGSSSFEVRHRLLHKNGSYRWMVCRGAAQRNAEGQVVQVNATHLDVTAETVSDPLTGLPNQLLLVEHLTRSIERAGRYPGFHFALLCIDIGRPDDTDGALGRTADLILPAVARRLETCLRTREIPPTLRQNDLVAHLLDDQFAILLDGLKQIGHAAVAADRILAELLEPFAFAGREVRLSPSIGVAVSATGYTTPDEVLRDADAALHRARLLGGARYETFDTAVLQTAQAELQLHRDFEGALDRGEVELFYQPVVSLVSDQIVGFEALMRWRHPDLGLISPLEFVPIAEKTGFIVPLGRWALHEACLRLKTWQDAHLVEGGPWVSVNLSSLQFRDPALLDDIAEVLRITGLDARCLVLEVTEGVALENPAEVRTLLMRLRTLGVRISVDDFGTGYSSLAYLRQLPLDSLKVDRAFVRGIEGNKDMVSILTAVVRMAQQLGLQVVVEGIENEEQRTLVRSLSCAYGQGYFFSRPLDLDGITALLAAGPPSQQTGSIGTDHGMTSMLETPATAQAGGQWTGRVASVAVTVSILALVASVGVPRYFAESSPLLQPSSVATGADIALPDSSESGTPIGSALPHRAVKVRPRTAAASASPAPASPTPVSPTPALSASASPASRVTPPLLVVHQHRLGSCRGVLIASGSGLEFVPDANGGDRDHAFRLQRDQFLDALAEDTLIIRSHDKVYRFKTAAGAGSPTSLAEFVESLSRSR